MKKLHIDIEVRSKATEEGEAKPSLKDRVTTVAARVGSKMPVKIKIHRVEIESVSAEDVLRTGDPT